MVLSLDDINEERGLYGGQGIPGEEWGKTLRIAEERAGAQLRAGTDVIVDDTGSPRFVRDHWRDVASREKARFSLVWVQMDTALQQKRLRQNRCVPVRNDVTDEVMADHVSGFEPPTEEGAIAIDARDVRDPRHVRRIADELRRGDGRPAS